jgi:CelD/BcsL family acetyltransferase involved in cellulose biosynthesis
VNVNIIESARAWSYLHDSDFLHSWSDLAGACPWATVFQSVDFCKIWYECYSDVQLPLLIVGMDSGRLVGLVPLAVSKARDQLSWAGDYHAEYHTWLAIPPLAEQFIESAVDALFSKFPRGSLTFFFMAPGTPTKWLQPPARWSRLVEARKVQRPFIVIDPDVVNNSLRKKNTRSKLNRLRKMGELEFKVLRSPQELEKIFDEVMLLKRYRHLAVHGQERPAFDDRKRRFYLKSMERGLLHATAMTLNGRLISAHIGNRNNSAVLLGVLAHSPFFAAHSPGKLHIAMLATKLWEEGITAFDLTPGGEYKERFANGVDQVYSATLFFDRRDYLAFRLKGRLKSWCKDALVGVGVDPSSLVPYVRRGNGNPMGRSGLPRAIAARLRRQLWSTTEYRLYRMTSEDAGNLLEARLVQRDSLEDLLTFASSQPGRVEFMEQSLAMIESGAHPYTFVEKGELVHCTWVGAASESNLANLRAWSPPEGAVILTISYTAPETHIHDLHSIALCQIVRESAAMPGARHLFIAISANNLLCRKVIECLGFRHECCLFNATRLWRSRSWASPSPSISAYAEAAGDLDATRLGPALFGRRRGKNSLVPNSHPSNSIPDK